MEIMIENPQCIISSIDNITKGDLVRINFGNIFIYNKVISFSDYLIITC